MNEHHEPPTEDRDDVARLMRLAGRRPEVPGDRMARARAAARSQWEQEIRLRSRRRFAWAAAGLATAAVLVLALSLNLFRDGGASNGALGATFVVESIAGDAWVDDADGRRSLTTGDRLAYRSSIATGDASRVAILLASGHSVRLNDSSRVRLLEQGDLEVAEGVIYVDSGHMGSPQRALDVHTPLGVVHEIGTQFEVQVGESLRVRLREGQVTVERDRQSLEMQVGDELTVSRDGSISTRQISTYGSDWDWVAGITPMLDLDGTRARDFLEWVARERGWTLAFADAATARSADETELTGTVERMTLDEALDAVLPTCRMTYRVQDGVLIVSTLGDVPIL